MIEQRKHAILSASSAHRWTRCPASARLEELFMDEDTEFSKEGNIAHGYAEKILNNIYDILDQQIPDQEMELAVLDYTAYVTKLFTETKEKCNLAFKAHEVRLNFSEIVPEGFGTADTIIIADGTMHVIDFKYGKGVKVDAYENEQMLLYSLGAYSKYDMLYDIETVKMHIIQPRLDNYSTYEITILDLINWGDNLRSKAILAFNGDGDAIPGDHCQFCRARHLCKARANHLDLIKQEGKDVKLLSEEDIMRIYPHLDTVEKFIKDLKTHMLNKALDGYKWPGLKLVEGRSNRTYSDEIAVTNKLKSVGFQEAEFSTREMIGIPDMTKLLGKAKFKELLEDDGLIAKPVGKPTLVSETDKRPEYNVKDNLLAEFEIISEEEK